MKLILIEHLEKSSESFGCGIPAKNIYSRSSYKEASEKNSLRDILQNS